MVIPPRRSQDADKDSESAAGDVKYFSTVFAVFERDTGTSSARVVSRPASQLHPGNQARSSSVILSAALRRAETRPLRDFLQQKPPLPASRKRRMPLEDIPRHPAPEPVQMIPLVPRRMRARRTSGAPMQRAHPAKEHTP